MAIAVDAATVARFSTGSSPATSASFTPPANSLLVCPVSINTAAGVGGDTTVAGGSLTWTKQIEADHDVTGSGEGYAAIWTAPVGASPSAMTVVVTAVGGSTLVSGKVYIVTGQHASTPIGAKAAVASIVNNLSTGYTSTADASRGFGAATDWSQRGVPVSTDTGDGADFSGKVSVLSVFKAADTPTSGTAVTLNFDGFGASATDWQAAVMEVVPAASGGGGAAGAEVLSTVSLDAGLDQLR